MKLLTINTHSLIEENYSRKLSDFVNAVQKEKPDIIALQEVNQTAAEKEVAENELKGYFSCCKSAVIRRDNHVYNAAKLLSEKGLNYNWTWLPIKNGYVKFDEGIALMSLSPIIKTDILTVSCFDDYSNWKTRKLLGICTEQNPDEAFFSVHFGWWKDNDDPFENQWKRTDSYMKKYRCAWLMGDFNNPAEVRNEGYDMISKSGWYDSKKKEENYVTAHSKIDGWKDKENLKNGMRIDFIFCNKPKNFIYSKTIFDKKNYPVISDHFGVITEYL